MRNNLAAAILAALLLMPLQLTANELDPNLLKNPVRITGIVLNPDGSRVLGAVIDLLESGQTTVSNSEGVFVFERVFYPRITLQATSEDYETIKIGPLDTIQTGSESVTLTFTAVKTFESTIVITATREERLLKAVAALVSGEWDVVCIVSQCDRYRLPVLWAGEAHDESFGGSYDTR